jgi:hypothetical protein
LEQAELTEITLKIGHDEDHALDEDINLDRYRISVEKITTTSFLMKSHKI